LVPNRNRSSSSSSGSGLDTTQANGDGDHYVTLNGRGGRNNKGGDVSDGRARAVSKSTGHLNHDSSYDNPIFTVSGDVARNGKPGRRRENMVNGASKLAGPKAPGGMDQGLFHGGNVSAKLLFFLSFFFIFLIFFTELSFPTSTSSSILHLPNILFLDSQFSDLGLPGVSFETRHVGILLIPYKKRS
jgi:hypothetical protein